MFFTFLRAHVSGIPIRRVSSPCSSGCPRNVSHTGFATIDMTSHVGLDISANMRRHANKTRVAFLGLVHLEIALIIFFLRQTLSMSDRSALLLRSWETLGPSRQHLHSAPAIRHSNRPA
jgi:hypothetical protein